MNRVTLVATLLAATLGGCYMKPLRSNNPLHSSEGIQVRLLGQDCEDHVGSDGDPVSRDLSVKLELSNPTREVLEFAPDGVRLTVDTWEVGATQGGEVFQIAPGETRTFQMRFLHHAVCSRDFALAFDHAMRLGAQPVAMATLHFTPY